MVPPFRQLNLINTDTIQIGSSHIYKLLCWSDCQVQSASPLQGRQGELWILGPQKQLSETGLSLLHPYHEFPYDVFIISHQYFKFKLVCSYKWNTKHSLSHGTKGFRPSFNWRTFQICLGMKKNSLETNSAAVVLIAEEKKNIQNK